jgi:ATP/maltotriose-dependent transcriptional regulator MalT
LWPGSRAATGSSWSICLRLHRAAAAWHERQGLADEAIRHARAADDDLWAARLIERHVEALHRSSETAMLQRWFASPPNDLVRSRPRLCLQLARWASVAGRLDEVEPLLQATEAALAATADEPFEPSVGRELSVLANIPATIVFLRAEVARQRGDPERAAELIRLGLSRLTDADQALGLLERLHALAAAQGRVTSMIDARALQAMALDRVARWPSWSASSPPCPPGGWPRACPTRRSPTSW